MNIKFFILVFISILQFASLYPQTPSYYHYTSSDGLASSTAYDIIQDRDGFIWIATINGMSRFDGTNFTTYRTKDGLNSNSIISLVEGKNGELYIGNYEKGVNVLRNGRIENFCDNVGGKSFSISYLLLAPSGENEQKLYAYRSGSGIISISKQNNARLVTHNISTTPIKINRLEVLQNSGIIALTTSGLFNFENTRLLKMRIKGLPDTVVFSLANGSDGSYFIGSRGMIYQIKNGQVIRKYEINIGGNNDVSAILTDKSNNVWFSVMNKGFFLIPDGSGRIIDIGSKMGLGNTLVNNYLEDNEGNIWLSTYGKGVYCLNNLYLTSYNENDGLSSNSIYSIAKERSGKLIIGTFNGINILNNGTFEQIKTNSKKTLTEYIYRIKNLNNEIYICGAFGEVGVKTISYKGIILHLFDWASFLKTSSGLYLFSGSGNYIRVERSLNYEHTATSMFYIFPDSLITNRTHEIFEDTQKNIWIGTSLGLCKITPASANFQEWKKSFFPADPVLNARINSITQDNKHYVWFAGEKGVASYNLRNDSVKTYTNFNGYDLSTATSVVSDNKNRIWIGNMKGLYLVDGSSIKYLNKQTGLPSDEVLSLYYDSDKNLLYVGTSNGISFLDVNLFDSYKPSPPRVKIIGITAGDSLYKSYSHLVFEPEQNHVIIDFKALSFSSPGSVRYRYNLNGRWRETDHDFLDFISLENGKYALQIMAKAQNTGWSESTFLTFRVQPKFTETIWFDLLIISLVLLGSLFMVTWRLRINRKKIRQELELTERFNKLEHQALSAMMNPHFISNSLNSVQYLVNTQRYEEANDYIAMMAKLMRKNLDTAGSGFILLSEEINRLKLYLDLEKLRFQESFSYEIITGTDINTDSILIPNMIIQPFVENSLWHGIIDSGNKGILAISFTFEDVDIDSFTGRSLIIKVTDNGIGIIEAKKNKKEDHISKGIQIIEERLRLLSTKMHLPQPIMFEDLSAHDTDAHGTEVIISLPPPLYKISVQE